MITNLDEREEHGLPAYDLCIVGTGPSGMTLVNELIGSGLRICVLESGKRKPTRLGDRLREVRSEGIHIKDYSRERVLGGASTTWSGLSSPLDPADMEPRPFLRHSGWPLKREELLPYYDRAVKGYRFPPLRLFDEGGLAALREQGDWRPSWTLLEEKVFLAPEEPQNFGREFLHALEAPGVDGYLDTTLLRLEGGAGKGRIARGIVRTSGGREMPLEARAFVLATGGIENARILLNSTDHCPGGLGNEHDQVGRYMMNHPKNYYGVIRLSRPIKELPYYFGCLYRGFAGYGGIKLKRRVQEEKGLLNSYVRFEPLFPWSDHQGVEAFVLLAKRCKNLLKGWLKRGEAEVVSLRDYAETGDDSDLQNRRKSPLDWILISFKILFSLHRILQYVYFRALVRSAPRIRKIRLRNFMEMEPDPENRVVLGEEKDVYGQPVPVVRHACSERDRRSLTALHEALVEELPASGLGRLSTGLDGEKTWPINQDASHHMGTTRMGEDPLTSVVNRHCRLHTVENVYLAGASVFPTSGCANPTFTVVALAIRLAEHLKKDVYGLKESNGMKATHE